MDLVDWNFCLPVTPLFYLIYTRWKGVNLANSLYRSLILCQIKNEGFTFGYYYTF